MFFVWPFVMIFRWYSNQNGACGHLNIHLPHRLTAPMEKYTNQMWQPKTRFRGGWSCLRCLVTLAKFDLKTFGWRRGRWLVPRDMWHVNVPCGSLRIHYSWNGSRKEDLWSHGQVETQPVVNRHNTNRSARISIASSGCSEWNMKLDEKKKTKPKMLRSNRKARRKRKRFHWRNRIYPAVHPRCSRSIHSSHQRLFCVPHSFGERPAAANPFAAQQSSPFHCVTRWRPSADQKGPNLILFSGQVKSQQLDCLSSPLSAIHQSRNEAIETIVKWNSPTRIGVDPIKLNVQ